MSDTAATAAPSAPPAAPAAWGGPVCSVIVLLGFCAFCGLALLGKLPDGNIAIALIGAWIGLAQTVVSYWLGSSAGSRAKDAQIATHQAVLDRLPSTTSSRPTP